MKLVKFFIHIQNKNEKIKIFLRKNMSSENIIITLNEVRNLYFNSPPDIQTIIGKIKPSQTNYLIICHTSIEESIIISGDGYFDGNYSIGTIINFQSIKINDNNPSIILKDNLVELWNKLVKLKNRIPICMICNNDQKIEVNECKICHSLICNDCHKNGHINCLICQTKIDLPIQRELLLLEKLYIYSLLLFTVLICGPPIIGYSGIKRLLYDNSDNILNIKRQFTSVKENYVPLDVDDAIKTVDLLLISEN
jgi:hypothetical protein